MTIDKLLNYFETYGLWLLFIIVFLEYLNLPGLPAGIIMPAVGIMISRSEMTFITSTLVSVAAGVLGSSVLYCIGKFLGKPIIEKLLKRYPKMQKSIDKTYNCIDRYGNKGVFISRLIPVARTLISIISGTFDMDFIKFVFYSTLGITIWNSVFIYAGYAFGYLFI